MIDNNLTPTDMNISSKEHFSPEGDTFEVTYVPQEFDIDSVAELIAEEEPMGEVIDIDYSSREIVHFMPFQTTL